MKLVNVFLGNVFLASIVSLVAWTWTREKIFAGVRHILSRYNGRWWATLLTCYFCVSHWVALVLCIVVQPTTFFPGLRGFVVNYLFVWFLAVPIYQWFRARILKGNILQRRHDRDKELDEPSAPLTHRERILSTMRDIA